MPNDFVDKLSSCRFESCCRHLKFMFRDCFEEGVPWHSGNYRVWVNSKTRTWHDKNMSLMSHTDKFSEPCKSTCKVWLNGWMLRTKCLLVRVSLQPLKVSISHMLRAMRSLIFSYYSVLIYSETRTWHDEKIQSNARYR